MCSQCDGRIPYDAESCPYCASDSEKGAQHQVLQESLTAPYAFKKTNPTPMSMIEKKSNTSSSFGIPPLPAAGDEAVAKEGKSGFVPIFLLSLGGNLLTLGLLQLLFSEQGALKLEWDSSYWAFYCLAALPLFYLGLKKARHL